MIEQQTIDGRSATISYFDDQFNPVDDLSQPHFAKVLFDDGEMLILSSDGTAEPEPAESSYFEEGQHDAEPFDKHRARFAPRRLKLFGQSLATWASMIIANDAMLIDSAISIGLTAGDDNTDIAHRVIGSRRMNGSNGATEITRQYFLRLGRGYLRQLKTRMGGASTNDSAE